MCGIAGAFNWQEQDLREQLQIMQQKLHHRGPDDGDIWVSEDKHIGLVHRRLSILDLSPAGRQPMHSSSGRFSMVYNGEIYNYKSLLKEIGLNGHSEWGDSRVLIECFEKWGIQNTLPRLSGMFSIGVWDHEEKSLLLARDPIGIKPLYFGELKQGWVFASELHALQHFFEPQDLNLNAVAQLLRVNTIPSPLSVFAGIQKCPPGHYLKLSLYQKEPQTVPYFSIYQAVQKGIGASTSSDYKTCVDQLDTILRQSVLEHMASDVPLGSFLSGGIDSSLVSAIAQSLSNQELKTFTIGMHESGYNEAEHAKEIAKHLGTEHHEFYLDPLDMANEVPFILDQLDEPFADSSLIPTYFVSKLTRQHVTVSLSGDGGDELFCGYTRYRWAKQIWSKLKFLPAPLRHLLRVILKSRPPHSWQKLLNNLEPIIPGGLPEVHMGQKFHRLASMLHATSPKELYQCLVSHLEKPELHMMQQTTYDFSYHNPHWNDLNTIEEQMMLTDLMAYLPNDILTKVDRASMMVSLEARVPLLTPKIVEFAWSLPLEYKKEKRILKDVLKRYVPNELIDRPKMGFGIAIGEWLNGPLNSWANSLLDQERLKKQNIFKPEVVTCLWNEHQNKSQNHEYLLWNYLVFQHWYRNKFE